MAYSPLTSVVSLPPPLLATTLAPWKGVVPSCSIVPEIVLSATSTTVNPLIVAPVPAVGFQPRPKPIPASVDGALRPRANVPWETSLRKYSTIQVAARVSSSMR